MRFWTINEAGYCLECGRAPAEARVKAAKEELRETQAKVLSNEDFISIIGPQWPKYYEKFKSFKMLGCFSVTWNWPAFFFGFLWMLYRKLYLWAAISFTIMLIPDLLHFSMFLQIFYSILVMLASGIAGNYIYYQHVLNRIIKARTQRFRTDRKTPTEVLEMIGGVNRWVIWISIVIFALIATAIGIPQISLLLQR